MAKTFTNPFAQEPKTASAVAVTAVGSLTTDAPTNTVLLLTAGSEGALLTAVSAMPRATVTASSLLLFISSDSGTTKRLFDSEVMAAQTVNTTTAINEVQFQRYSESAPKRLKAGDQIYAGSQVSLASGIVFAAEYTDF